MYVGSIHMYLTKMISVSVKIYNKHIFELIGISCLQLVLDKGHAARDKLTEEGGAEGSYLMSQFLPEVCIQTRRLRLTSWWSTGSRARSQRGPDRVYPVAPATADPCLIMRRIMHVSNDHQLPAESPNRILSDNRYWHPHRQQYCECIEYLNSFVEEREGVGLIAQGQ